MDINVENIDHMTVIDLKGKLNASSLGSVEMQLLSLAQPGQAVLVDMSNVTYLSSAGLRTLLLLYRRVHENHGMMALAGMNEEVTDIMSITGFLDLFTIYSDRNEGLEALRKAS
jgi:anti-sigma B factor antagonist